MKTRKVFEGNFEGIHLTVEFREGRQGPFKVYRKWHRKQIAQFNSVEDSLVRLTECFKQVHKFYSE